VNRNEGGDRQPGENSADLLLKVLNLSKLHTKTEQSRKSAKKTRQLSATLAKKL